VIATRAQDGRYVGLTASSFNSLSLEPPLILWSLASSATSLEVFKGQRFFSVSILSVEQVDLARRFAARLTDRFEGVAVHEGLDGIPLIDGAVGWFECERRTQHHHGDHWLFIGEVKRCAAADGSPLVFRQGEFASAGALDAPALAPLSSAGGHPLEGFEPGDQPFYEEYLPFLLARAGHHVAGGFNRQLQRHGLGLLSWRVLAALSSRDDWTIGELSAASLAKQPTISKLIDRLVRQGIAARRVDPADARRVLVSLTPKGHADIAPVLQDAAAFNLSLLTDYPPETLTGLKHLLRDIIARHPAP
jgi:3-hydroxy-9,10-secoandrosta-1,3,5(10)-triene-9,17-dione monooxygenase reductase component